MSQINTELKMDQFTNNAFGLKAGNTVAVRTTENPEWVTLCGYADARAFTVRVVRCDGGIAYLQRQD